jgi:thioredoxin reductase (NADPH)
VAEETFERTPAFPRLGSDFFGVLDRAGRRRPLERDARLYRAGERNAEFFVMVRGKIALIDRFGSAAERVVGMVDEHGFAGELNLMTGQPASVTAVVREAGEAIVLTREQLEDVISAHQSLGDVVLGAFLARRAKLIGSGSGMQVIGSRLDANSRRLREFLTRNRIPHGFVDVESDGEAAQLLRALSVALEDTPLLRSGPLVLRNPTNGEIAAALNLTTLASKEVCDTVVVGAGPAGLGAAVYAASEGLTTVLVDSVALGGQASTSARIENYLGFPAGISGAELAERASVQARRFGARTLVPGRVRLLALEGGYHVLELDGGDRLRARSVVIATGASYRRLDVARLADFEGAGVYYAATEVEAQMCNGDPVVVVGGANSAGQAALFLATRVSHVDLLLRGGDLGAGMSSYLVEQVRRADNIDVHLNTEVRELHGDRGLDAITIERTDAHAEERLDACGLFVFIGADPCTAWLSDTVSTDADGFLLTGADLHLTHLDPARDGRERAPLPLETSRPGVFAAGDVRSGSIKRVASAVGEGAMAVRLIHQHLALLNGARQS